MAIQFLCIYRIVFCFVLFILCSIWFRFISILGTLRRLKKIIFDVLIKWVIIWDESFYVGPTKMSHSHFFTWTCLVGAVPFLFLLFGRVELESDAATETGDSETLFWASLISSPISSVVEASVWTFQFYSEKKKREIFSSPAWLVLLLENRKNAITSL